MKDYSKLNDNAEPAPFALELPTPKQNWTFLVDTTVPENLRLPVFGQWCTSYFDHADIVGDLDKLSWVLASPNRTPTFFNGLPLSIQRYGEDAATDLPFLFLFSKQILAAYRKAFFDPGVLPNMKRTLVCGDKTCAFGIVGLWAVQGDEQELWTVDAKAVKYRIIQEAHHLVRICASSEIKSLCCIHRFIGMTRKRRWMHSSPCHRLRWESCSVYNDTGLLGNLKYKEHKYRNAMKTVLR